MALVPLIGPASILSCKVQIIKAPPSHLDLALVVQEIRRASGTTHHGCGLLCPVYTVPSNYLCSTVVRLAVGLESLSVRYFSLQVNKVTEVVHCPTASRLLLCPESLASAYQCVGRTPQSVKPDQNWQNISLQK